MKKIQPANRTTELKLHYAITALKEARSFLKFARCPKVLERVRLALTSADGARRHMEHRMRRTAGPV